MSKNFQSELSQRIAQTAMKVIGRYGNVLPGSALAALNGQLARTCMSSTSATIAADISTINRNGIAARGLGLPRG